LNDYSSFFKLSWHTRRFCDSGVMRSSAPTAATLYRPAAGRAMSHADTRFHVCERSIWNEACSSAEAAEGLCSDLIVGGLNSERESYERGKAADERFLRFE